MQVDWVDAHGRAVPRYGYAAAARSPRPDQAILPLAEKAKYWAQKGLKEDASARQAHRFYSELDSMLFLARQQFRHDESKIAFAQTVRDIYENAMLNAVGQHPFFWAGTVGFGNCEPLFVDFYWKWLAVLFGLLLVAGLWLQWRKKPFLVQPHPRKVNQVS